MSTKAKPLAAAEAQLLRPEFKPMPQPSVGMYLCAFHVGKWEADESVVDAYHRALDITAVQFHRMLRADFSALKENVYKMMTDRGIDLTTCSEAEKEVLWLTLVEEARKGGM